MGGVGAALGAAAASPAQAPAAPGPVAPGPAAPGGTVDYQTQVMEIYKKYNPSKLGDVDKLIHKYK